MNITAKYQANTDQLPESLAIHLKKLIEESDILNLKQTDIRSSANIPPDIFSYALKLDAGDRKTALKFNDVTIPSSLQSLTSVLRELALQQTGERRMSQHGQQNKI